MNRKEYIIIIHFVMNFLNAVSIFMELGVLVGILSKNFKIENGRRYFYFNLVNKYL